MCSAIKIIVFDHIQFVLMASLPILFAVHFFFAYVKMKSQRVLCKEEKKSIRMITLVLWPKFNVTHNLLLRIRALQTTFGNEWFWFDVPELKHLQKNHASAFQSQLFHYIKRKI